MLNKNGTNKGVKHQVTVNQLRWYGMDLCNDALRKPVLEYTKNKITKRGNLRNMDGSRTKVFKKLEVASEVALGRKHWRIRTKKAYLVYWEKACKLQYILY